MADTTGGTPPTNASPFAVPADIKAVYDHFGDPDFFSRTTASALPASDNWKGRRLYVEDEDASREWTGTEWQPVTHVPTNRQSDVANAVVNTITQFGAGKIIGNNAAFQSETVTFPVAFASVPTVVVTAQGSRAAGAFNETGLTIGAVAASVAAKSSAGFTVGLLAPGASMSSANDWYYNWVAIGVPA